MRRLILILPLCIGVTGCATHPPRIYTPPPRNSPDSPDRLFNRLGGKTGIEKIVDDFTTRILSDPRVDMHRRNTLHPWQGTESQISNFKAHFAQYLIGITGGPSSYTGKPLLEAHAGMQISSENDQAFLADLVEALKQNGVSQDNADSLLQLLSHTKDELIEVP